MIPGDWEAEDPELGGFAGITEMWNLNKPVIAALNGLTIGGGFEIALACDLIIAADHVEFALPELPLGLIPDAGAVQRMPRRLPYNIALEMLYLGRRMSASEAMHYGLINKAVAAAELMDAARAIEIIERMGARVLGHDEARSKIGLSRWNNLTR